jgi:hypothetical protein
MTRLFVYSLCLFGAFVCPASAAEITVKDRASLVTALQGAKAGTVIVVAPGTYEGGLSAAKLRGEKGKPVIVRASDPKQPPVFEGGGSGIHLSACSYVELEHLTFTNAKANGINIDDGGSHGEPSKGIVLRNLTVTNAVPKGNRDGIKLSGLDDFMVSGCRVERWGSSGSAIDMVGCHDGSVENCDFEHDPATAPQANGVQAKGGSARIAVRRCRFKGAGGRGVNLGGSTGADYFRPLKAPSEAKDLTVEDCYFTGIQAPVAFVGVDGAVVRNNTIEWPGRWALRILQENQSSEVTPCRKGSFTDNIIVYRSGELAEAVNIGPGTEPASFTFARNAWYCSDRPGDSRRRVRFPSPETGGVYGTDPKLAPDGQPAAAALAGKAGIRAEGAAGKGLK